MALQVNQDRAVIEKSLTEVFQNISKNRILINKLRKELTEHGLKAGDIADILKGEKALSEVSLSVLCLFMIKIFEETELELSNPEKYFTAQEIKQCQTLEIINEERITLPYEFQNVTFVKDSNYSTVITAQELKKLWDSGLLSYKFETQREAKVERDKDDNIILKPKTNPKSVAEIAELVKTGDLETTTITLNALSRSSESGEELIYDHKKRTLTVTKGTEINILDGYHRLSGILRALEHDNSLDAIFDLKILNYSVRRAVKYFNQINRVNPISESRLKETNVSSMDTVAFEELKANCESLTGKIASSEKIYTSADQLVSSKILIDAIDEHFNPTNRIEALETGEYLAKFFDTLFMTFPEAFVTDIKKTRETSIINANFMFDPYVLAAKKLQGQKITRELLSNLFSQLDFERSNPLWKEIGVLDDDNTITTNPKKKVRKLFSDLIEQEVSANV